MPEGVASGSQVASLPPPHPYGTAWNTWRRAWSPNAPSRPRQRLCSTALRNLGVAPNFISPSLVVTSPALLGFWSHNAGAILNRENASTRGPGEAQRTLTSSMQAAVMLPFGLSQEQVSALVLVVSRPAARMVTHVCRTRVPAWQGAGGPQGGTAELPGMYGGAQMAPMRTIAGRLGGVADSGDGQPLQNVSVHQYYEKQQPPMQYAEYPPQQHVMTTGWVPCDVLPNKMSTVHDVWSGANFCEEVAEMLRAHAASKYFSQGVTEPKPHMMGGKLRVR